MNFNVLMDREELDAYLKWLDGTATPDHREFLAKESKEAMHLSQQFAKVGGADKTAPEPTTTEGNTPEPAKGEWDNLFFPEAFNTDGDALHTAGLEETKKILAQLANACNNKNASFRLIEYYAGAGAGLSKVDPKKYYSICQSAYYLLKYPKALQRWANGEDTTKQPE